MNFKIIDKKLFLKSILKFIAVIWFIFFIGYYIYAFTLSDNVSSKTVSENTNESNKNVNKQNDQDYLTYSTKVILTTVNDLIAQDENDYIQYIDKYMNTKDTAYLDKAEKVKTKIFEYLSLSYKNNPPSDKYYQYKFIVKEITELADYLDYSYSYAKNNNPDMVSKYENNILRLTSSLVKNIKELIK